jgi:enediyne polyketide synthase
MEFRRSGNSRTGGRPSRERRGRSESGYGPGPDRDVPSESVRIIPAGLAGEAADDGADAPAGLAGPAGPAGPGLAGPASPAGGPPAGRHQEPAPDDRERSGNRVRPGAGARLAAGTPDANGSDTTWFEASDLESAFWGDSAVSPARHAAEPIAIVGLACRFPDADDAAALFGVITTGRRAFRRIPPCRVDLADYYSSDPATPDATYSTRAALLEGWRFDRAAFGISQATYASVDPAHWLAIETSARALAAAGFPGGNGLPRERAGVFIGSTLAGDVAQASGLRLRWPYTRQVLADALFSVGAPTELADRVLTAAAARYLAPFPPVTAETLIGATPGTIAAAICALLGFAGGGFAVDAGGASSLAAIASACSALVSGQLDVAIAGGVDASLDPLDLVGLAKAGALATGDVRIYDESPTGFLPGEGCGMVLLMREADAVAADLPIYAEIAGWGMASASQPRRGSTDPGGLLLAMRKAYEMARIDPADIGYVEGCGTGVGHADEAELTALSQLLASARQPVVLGSVTANIGHTRAAAGSAGLIKTVLAAANAVLPAATGISTPHQVLREASAVLRTPGANEPWTDRVRRAGVSARSADGLNVHLVLTRQPDPAEAGRRGSDANHPSVGSPAGRRRAQEGLIPPRRGNPATFLLQAADRTALTAILARITDVAPWLSDAQLQDLACQLAIEAADQGKARVAIIATRQEQLARLANEAITMLPKLAGGLVSTRPGIFAADDADGRVTLLLAGQQEHKEQPPQQQFDRAMAVLRRLDQLGVRPTAAVGHGIGELAGLVWAGCLIPADASTLSALRAAALNDTASAVPGSVRKVLDSFATFGYQSPGRPLFSGSTGNELTSAAEVARLLSAELLDSRSAGASPQADYRLADAVRVGVTGASLLLQSGRDRELTRAIGQLGTGHGGAGQRRKVAVVSIDGDPDDDRSMARAAAALFAAGALGRPEALYAGHPARPIDIWREQVFITNPCQTHPAAGPAEPRPARTGRQRPAETQAPAQAEAQTPALAPTGVAVPERAPAQAETGAPAQTAAAPEGARPAEGSADVDSGTGHEARSTEPAVTGHDTDHNQPNPASAPKHIDAAHQAGPGPTAVIEAGAGPETDDNQPSAGSAPSHAEWASVGPAEPVIGIGPWSRCYVERTQALDRPVEPAGDQPWQLFTGDCEFLRPVLDDLVRSEPRADRTLAVLGRLPGAATLESALLAARSAMSTGRLVVLSPDSGLAGLWASLRAEHPRIGVVTVRAPLTPESVRAATGIAAVPGQFRELTIEPDGSMAEAVMVPLPPGPGGDFPLGTSDVVLISRNAGAAGLALAQVLACSGAAIVVIGRDHPRHDDAVIAALEQLRLAGTAVGYEIVNPSSAAALDAAVARIEQRFGPVTAVAHAISAAPPHASYELTPAQAHAYVLDQVRMLDQLVAAVQARPAPPQSPSRLKLIATFGSVAGRYGLAGGSLVALATGALAGHGEQIAADLPGCAALHVDWPGWAGAGLGERADWTALMKRAGCTPLSVQDGSRQLMKLMTMARRPGRSAVHGRVGLPPPRPVAIAGSGPATVAPPEHLAGATIVHYPGVELITQLTISPQAESYLADYVIDGVRLVPPAIALEAMAQVASVLAGSPMRSADGVVMNAPIVLSDPQASAVLRICGLRTDEIVTVVVRCDSTGFAVDHFSASFGGAPPASPVTPVRLEEAADGEPAAAVIDGSEVYGPVCFQTGRFRLLTSVRLSGSRAAVALAEETEPWLDQPADGPGPAAPLLGSPGLGDAMLQLAQVCVPHRRLLFAGCDHFEFAEPEALGPIALSAVQVVPTSPSLVPRQRRGDGTPTEPIDQRETSWDIDAVDSGGRVVAYWRRLRMRDAGPLPRTAAWPAPLAACVLERAAAECGLGPSLEVRIGLRPEAVQAARAARAGLVARGRRAGSGRRARRVPVTAVVDPRWSAGSWTSPASTSGALAGLDLMVRAEGQAGCAWQVATPAAMSGQASQPSQSQAWLAVVSEQHLQAGDAGTALALAEVIATCTGGAGPPPQVHAEARYIAGTGWLLVQAGPVRIVATVLDLAEAGLPVAVAIMTNASDRVAKRPRPQHAGRGGLIAAGR